MQSANVLHINLQRNKDQEFNIHYTANMLKKVYIHQTKRNFNVFLFDLLNALNIWISLSCIQLISSIFNIPTKLIRHIKKIFKNCKPNPNRNGQQRPQCSIQVFYLL